MHWCARGRRVAAAEPSAAWRSSRARARAQASARAVSVRAVSERVRPWAHSERRRSACGPGHGASSSAPAPAAGTSAAQTAARALAVRAPPARSHRMSATRAEAASSGFGGVAVASLAAAAAATSDVIDRDPFVLGNLHPPTEAPIEEAPAPRTGVYFSDDPIGNLRLRVRLTCVRERPGSGAAGAAGNTGTDRDGRVVAMPNARGSVLDMGRSPRTPRNAAGGGDDGEPAVTPAPVVQTAATVARMKAARAGSSGAIATAAAAAANALPQAREHVIEVGWQEKVFGLAEVERIRSITHPQNELEREYKNLIVAYDQERTGGQEYRGSTLYTYTARDHWSIERAELEQGPAGGPSVVSAQPPHAGAAGAGASSAGAAGSASASAAGSAVGTRPQAAAPSQSGAPRLPLGTPLALEDEPAPLVRERKMHRSMAMYIVANVDAGIPIDDDVPRAVGREHVLVQVRAHGKNHFEIFPDFSVDMNRPYEFITPDGEAYSFTVENASEMVDLKQLAADQVAKQRYQKRQLDLRANLVGTAFDDVPRDGVAFMILGEIVDARGFDAERVFVRCKVDVPDSWTGVAPDVVCTQMCTGAWHMGGLGDYVRHYHFAFPLEMQLSAPLHDTVTPTLFFEVGSIDSWERSTVLGYGWLALPALPGHAEHVVRCWKPRAPARWRMVEYFIGGNIQLSSPELSAVPPDSFEYSLNKYGFQTETTGEIRVRLHVATQSARRYNIEAKSVSQPRFLQFVQQMREQQAKEVAVSRVASLLRKTQ